MFAMLSIAAELAEFTGVVIVICLLKLLLKDQVRLGKGSPYEKKCVPSCSRMLPEN